MTGLAGPPAAGAPAETAAARPAAAAAAEREVLAAAAGLVAAFAASDAGRYFACFAPGASFVFHNVPGWLPDRASYERLWRDWEADGFRVERCRSLEPRVVLTGPGSAVFTHRVRTRLAGTPSELAERETIVFQRSPGGGWLAVHEHLSPDPRAAEEDT